MSINSENKKELPKKKHSIKSLSKLKALLSEALHIYLLLIHHVLTFIFIKYHTLFIYNKSYFIINLFNIKKFNSLIIMMILLTFLYSYCIFILNSIINQNVNLSIILTKFNFNIIFIKLF